MSTVFTFDLDTRIARPRCGTPFFDGALVHVPLAELEPDIESAVLLESDVGRSLVFSNRGDGTGELAFAPRPGAPGHGRLHARIRWSDGIQSVDGDLDCAYVAAGRLSLRFREDGAVLVAFPVPMLANRALVDPAAWVVTPVQGEPLLVTRIGRELRRLDRDGRVVPVDDPLYVDLFVTPPTAGVYLLTVPVLRTWNGGFFGPVTERFVASRVKGADMRRTLGKLAAPPGTPLGLVIDAIAASDTRLGGGSLRG